MTPNTHQALDPELCGEPLDLEPGFAMVEMRVTRRMAADASGMVHGGFTFGLADHAAMLAVNEPNVVLGSAEVRFRDLVVVGDLLRAEARLVETEKRKRFVEVRVYVAEDPEHDVLTGRFTCLVPLLPGRDAE